MKLSGNKKNGRYVSGSTRNQTPAQGRGKIEMNEDPRAARAAAKTKRSRKIIKIIAVFFVVVIAISAVLYVIYKTGVKPPKFAPPRPTTGANTSSSPVAEASGSPGPVSTDRKSEYDWTFAIIGFDDGNGNTDTMMVANFDATNHKLNVVNIPRDTLVNVSWNTKKINTLYANGGIEGVKNGLYDILGFDVDFYVMVDLKAFIELVDAVGGVDFDVPRNMDYDDPAQNLSIHFKAGVQHLDGQEAMEVVRYRKGYPDADIGRIGTQQDFLLTAAEQVLAKQNQLDITELAGIFLKYVKTDLNLGELVWLGKEFYKMDAENIAFATLPANYGDSVNHSSYVTIYINDWLKLLNEKINPFKEDVKKDALSILTRDENGKLYVTNGVWAGKKTWGSGSSSSSSGSGSSPSPSVKPSESPSPSPSPSDSPPPSPSDDVSPSPSDDVTSPDPSPTETGGEVLPSPSVDPSPSPSDSVLPSPSST